MIIYTQNLRNIEKIASDTLFDSGVDFSISAQRISFNEKSNETLFAFDVDISLDSRAIFIEEFVHTLRQRGWIASLSPKPDIFMLSELSFEDKLITILSAGHSKIIVEYKFNEH